MTNLGMLRTEKSEAASRNEIHRWLSRIKVADIMTSLSSSSNAAVLTFTYGGKPYEFRSTRQKNARLNLAAIAKVMENKIRHHVMQIEDFGTSMQAYLRLEGPADYAPETENASDTLMPSECALFQVEKYASNEQLKKAYLTKLKFFHPDRFDGQPEMFAEAQSRTAELNVAYEAICKRRGI